MSGVRIFHLVCSPFPKVAHFVNYLTFTFCPIFCIFNKVDEYAVISAFVAGSRFALFGPFLISSGRPLCLCYESIFSFLHHLFGMFHPLTKVNYSLCVLTGTISVTNNNDTSLDTGMFFAKVRCFAISSTVANSSYIGGIGPSTPCIARTSSDGGIASILIQ